MSLSQRLHVMQMWVGMLMQRLILITKLVEFNSQKSRTSGTLKMVISYMVMIA